MNPLYDYIRDHHILAIVDVAAARKSSTLDLSYNEIAEVPSNLAECAELTNLRLQCNNITKVCPLSLSLSVVGLFVSLVDIIRSINPSTVHHRLQIPLFLATLQHLHTITLDFNALTEFPAALCDCPSLTTLNISCNRLLQRIPADIGRLVRLEVLWCNNCDLAELPAELARCQRLDTLGARGNRLRRLPEELCQLPALRWLTLENNRLEALPAGLADANGGGSGGGGWPALRHLNVRNNCLTAVPPGLGAMRELRFCYLCSNAIATVMDADLAQTAHLCKLDLNENPFPDDRLQYKRYAHVVYAGQTTGRLPEPRRRQRAEEENATEADNGNNDGDSVAEESGDDDDDDDGEYEYSINTESIDLDEDELDSDAPEEYGADLDDDDGGGGDELANFLPQLSRFATIFG